MRNIKKKHLFIISVFVIAISLVVGYSFINSDVRSSGGVTISKYNCNQTNFYEKLSCLATIDKISSKNVSNTFGISYSSASGTTNGKGLYTMSSTLGSTYPIQYYRGAVDTNNVKFNNKCWQVIRTTETGGIKLIYAGSPDENGYCNNSTLASLSIGANAYNAGYDQPYYASYMYDDSYTTTPESNFEALSNYTFYSNATYSNGTYTLSGQLGSFQTGSYTCASTSNQCPTIRFYTGGDEYYSFSNGQTVDSLFGKVKSSLMKSILEDWYEDEMDTVNNQIEDTPYCADMTPNSSNLAESSKFALFFNKGLDLTCNSNYEYTVANGSLSKPVGLITIDEVSLSSGFAAGEQKIGDTYLTSKIQTIVGETGDSFWTMTPSISRTKYASILAVYKKSDGTLGGSNSSPTSTTIYIRPVISLKNSVTISGGDGTATNPFIVG